MTTPNHKISLGKLFLTIIFLLCFPALLLLLSGDWLWPEGWLFSLWYITLCLTVIIYLYRHNSPLLAERYRKPGTANQKGWDKYVVYGLLVLFSVWIILMPLDAKRCNWSPIFPIWLKLLGILTLIFSFLFFYLSYIENPYLSPLVRIQSERKQKVISTGVYGLIRHPMYLGAILLFWGASLLLGSVYGLMISFILTLLLAGRIIGEERMLVQELDGYAEYKKQVKYRLLPFIW